MCIRDRDYTLKLNSEGELKAIKKFDLQNNLELGLITVENCLLYTSRCV